MSLESLQGTLLAFSYNTFFFLSGAVAFFTIAHYLSKSLPLTSREAIKTNCTNRSLLSTCIDKCGNVQFSLLSLSLSSAKAHGHSCQGLWLIKYIYIYIHAPYTYTYNDFATIQSLIASLPYQENLQKYLCKGWYSPLFPFAYLCCPAKESPTVKLALFSGCSWSSKLLAAVDLTCSYISPTYYVYGLCICPCF